MYALALSNISQIQLLLGNCPKSIAAAKQALEIARDVNLPLIECDAALRLGTAFGWLGEKDKALKYLTEALSVAENAQMTRNISHINLGLAAYWREEGNLAESRKYASQAQSTAKDIGDRPALIQATAYVAAITAVEGLYFAAIKQLKQQYDEARALGDTLVIVQIGQLFGQTLLTCGKGEADRAEGRQLLESVLQTARDRDLANDIKKIEQILSQSLA
jgi:tetratricopeptide (TPR) repeat protein